LALALSLFLSLSLFRFLARFVLRFARWLRRVAKKEVFESRVWRSAKLRTAFRARDPGFELDSSEDFLGFLFFLVKSVCFSWHCIVRFVQLN
jgi:hypothetical protein